MRQQHRADQQDGGGSRKRRRGDQLCKRSAPRFAQYRPVADIDRFPVHFAAFVQGLFNAEIFHIAHSVGKGFPLAEQIVK